MPKFSLCFCKITIFLLNVHKTFFYQLLPIDQTVDLAPCWVNDVQLHLQQHYQPAPSKPRPLNHISFFGLVFKKQFRVKTFNTKNWLIWPILLADKSCCWATNDWWPKIHFLFNQSQVKGIHVPSMALCTKYPKYIGLYNSFLAAYRPICLIF